jgi:PIN domain nuclease of toxin-antitoxin system
VIRYLLDTHAALFWWSNASKLGLGARQAIEDPNAIILVSSASAWEIATKYRLGKMGDIGDPNITYRRLMARDAFMDLPIDTADSLLAGALPGSHGDPFDRIIAAQALIGDLTVITRDPEIAAFGCTVIW